MLDFGKITADMGIDIGASMENMADTTAESLAEVAKS
jgi:hypothetical protein